VIFVTGGAGFIGSQFVRDFLGRKLGKLIVFDSLTYAGNLDNLEWVAMPSFTLQRNRMWIGAS
jgi:dTDP-glucose 4,6-dehydratase